jgi:hypothetical protein
MAIEISSKTAQQTQWKLEPGNPINFDKLYPLQAGPGLELYKCLTAFLPDLKESSVISHQSLVISH